MRILITNDDGIDAPGIAALAGVAAQKGTVSIFAPHAEKSACGHGMSLYEPIRVLPTQLNGLEAHRVHGTPTDCVNTGMASEFKNGCDLVLSGFNYGPNLGFDITYSGTVAGAMEGALHGVRAIALSMALFTAPGNPHYETGARWLSEHWDMLVNMPLIPPTFLCINIPAIPYEDIKGYQLTRMGQKIYEGYLEQRHDPWSKPYYWYRGEVAKRTYTPGTDVHAVFHGYVSITPLTLDWTDHHILDKLASHLDTAEAPVPI